MVFDRHTLPADHVELLQADEPPALLNNINGVDNALQNKFNLKRD